MFSDGTPGKGEQNQWNPNAANEFAYKDVMNSSAAATTYLQISLHI